VRDDWAAKVPLVSFFALTWIAVAFGATGLALLAAGGLGAVLGVSLRRRISPSAYVRRGLRDVEGFLGGLAPTHPDPHSARADGSGRPQT
jgi:hypothetical protein